MIAHRLSTIMNADMVVYMEGGRIKATGSFAEVRRQIPNFDKQANLMGL
jgi:ABC-type multidrug transport system fused ATPase/permease subunit